MKDKIPQPAPPVNALLQAAGTVSLATLASRILGMVRDIVSAHRFGTSWQWDAFIYAFMFPNFLRRLMGEGALSSAFIPVYNEILQKYGRRQAFRYANAVGTLLVTGLAVVIVAVLLLLKEIIPIEFLPERLRLALELSQFLFPYLGFIALVALCMGILNSHKHFLAPAATPIILNGFWIAAVVWIVPQAGRAFEGQLRWLAAILLLAGAVQLLFQLAPLWQVGFRPRWIWDVMDAGVRRTAHLVLPAVFGFAVMQVNLLVDMTLAFLIGPGAGSSLWYGTRLMQFPLGVFAIAMGTALLPAISQLAAQKDFEAQRRHLSFALRAVFFVILPCTAGLMALSTPIVRLLFERGAFDATSTARTSAVLFCYAVGLFAYSGQKLLTTGFHAVQDTRAPVRIGVIALVANIVLNLILMHPLKEAGLALATSLSAILQFGLLWAAYDRKVTTLPKAEVVFSGLKLAAAAALTGLAAVWILKAVPGALALKVLLAVAGGVLTYAALCWILRVRELKELLGHGAR